MQKDLSIRGFFLTQRNMPLLYTDLFEVPFKPCAETSIREVIKWI